MRGGDDRDEGLFGYVRLEERVAADHPLQAFFSVRSARLLMEKIDYNLLFRWFVGLPMDAPV